MNRRLFYCIAIPRSWIAFLLGVPASFLLCTRPFYSLFGVPMQPFWFLWIWWPAPVLVLWAAMLGKIWRSPSLQKQSGAVRLRFVLKASVVLLVTLPLLIASFTPFALFAYHVSSGINERTYTTVTMVWTAFDIIMAPLMLGWVSAFVVSPLSSGAFSRLHAFAAGKAMKDASIAWLGMGTAFAVLIILCYAIAFAERNAALYPIPYSFGGLDMIELILLGTLSLFLTMLGGLIGRLLYLWSLETPFFTPQVATTP